METSELLNRAKMENTIILSIRNNRNSSEYKNRLDCFQQLIGQLSNSEYLYVDLDL